MASITRTYTFTDGTTAYGSQVESELSTVVTAFNNHEAGTSTWAVVKTSLLSLANGTAAAPSAVFSSDTTTGFYRVAASQVGISLAGVASIIFAGGVIQTLAGAVSAPCFSLINDPTTGFYAVAAGSLGYSGSGTLRATFAASAPYVTIGNNGNTTEICLRINGVSTTAAQTATMTNGPTAGNPVGWLQVNINGSNRYMPFWA